MIKRFKGLLALWMALLMAVSLPVTTFAATTDEVYYYTETEALEDGDQVTEQKREKLTGDEAFQVDKSLSEQFSSKIPTGYNLTGWKLWKADSGFNVYSAYDIQLNGTISQAKFDSQFSTADNVVLEPLLELKYKISHQPTNAEPYVSVNEESVVSTYEWYSVQTTEYSVVENVSIDGVGNYDTSSDTWIGVDSDGTGNYSLSLSIGGLSVGDTLQITPIENNDMGITVSRGNFSLSQNGDGIWSGTISSEDYFGLNITGTSAFSVKIVDIYEDITLVDGQDESIFSGPNGTYFCKVTFTNGASLNSEVFTYTRYDITSNPSSNGSYKLQVGGADVEKAAPEDIVTIVPSPNTGYELDTVTVTKTDYSDTVVTVTNNSFTMPDYPVTVDVTFKIKTYAVTLPQGQMGYTVKSEQTSPVEHGSNYTFTVTINDGYVASENFAVKANNIALLTETDVSGNAYKCSINNVTEAQEITVTGVEEKHDITKIEATGGSYTVTADSSEVTTAIKDTKVTITPVPEEGYELEKITVTKTSNADDSTTEVTVTDNSFTMPDYPVTVSVTFKIKTYEVTLPTETIGYTVESTQTSSVEHGSPYTFTVTINDGYIASENFSVKANNNTLTATDVSGNVYTYTIKNITEAQEITVIGVVKKYDVTKTDAAGGSYTVTTDGSEVTEAIKDTKITIEAKPSEGYELDTVTVTKTGDSNTEVTVTDGIFTMPDYPVTVSVTFKRKTYSVILPKNPTGYTVTSTQESPVEYGSDYTFTVTLGEGYVASADYTVKANDTQLTATAIGVNVYTYTIKGITEVQTITVSGVADGMAPAITITLDENTWWKSFLNQISFGLFFKEPKSLIIEATDEESGIGLVWYYLSNEDLFPEDKIYTATEIESVITQWTAYTGSVALSNDDSYVLYAKAVDQAGNVAYASTTGIVVDTMVPAITGIENGKTYYGDISFTIRDTYLKSVTVDEVPKTVTGNSYTDKITADNKTHKITAVDEAGNEVIYEIEVNVTKDTTSTEGDNSSTQSTQNSSAANTSNVVIESDTTAPVITGIENGGIYYGDTSFTVSDDNLATLTLDNQLLDMTGGTHTIIIAADNGTHTIRATDRVGNSFSCEITVYETWMRDGITSGGVYYLRAGIPYKLGSGTWKVTGDNTLYKGGTTFYVWESGTFEFRKQ